MQIDCDFPGGNIVIEAIDGDRVRLHQDLRDTDGDWFYWSFRVHGAEGRTVRFDFTRSSAIGVRGPCFSSDGGQTWRWLGAGCVEGNSFTHSFDPSANDARFSFCIPYLEPNLRSFLARHEGNSHLKCERLCTSKKGRSIELLRAGKLGGAAAHRVLLTCRHHSCESTANFALEGILDAALANDELGRWFCANVEIAAVPFMDKDGVEDGDQGKNRKPYDHNRDYAGTSIYPSVAALRRFAPDWSGGRLRAALDLHCPSIRGKQNECIYFVGAPAVERWPAVQRFGEIVERVRRGTLPYTRADNMPFGTGWNTYDGPLKTCQSWAGELPGVLVATTLEIPYANVGEQTVTPENARAFGHDLAAALKEFMIDKH